MNSTFGTSLGEKQTVLCQLFWRLFTGAFLFPRPDRVKLVKPFQLASSGISVLFLFIFIFVQTPAVNL